MHNHFFVLHWIVSQLKEASVRVQLMTAMPWVTLKHPPTSVTCTLSYTRIFGSEFAVSRCCGCENHSCLSGTCRLKETTRLHIPEHNNPDLFPLSVYPFITSLQSVPLYVATNSCIIYIKSVTCFYTFMSEISIP